MTTAEAADAGQVLAASSNVLNVIAAFAGGLIVVALLIWAVRLGVRTKEAESPPPGPEEHPRLPETGPVHEEREQRAPNEVPHTVDESERLTPHNLHSAGTKRGDDQTRPRWSPGNSGSFGSGGSGRK
ncbi:hypothetical protein ADL01_31475 [Streptomyces sp. NRRL WC-3618]|uniref:DUF6479 family protein n=1 Tax=Streptomyces sp. NRRL WC-3618 TaxID=1519490 RepID=UPI0006AFEE9D|nr:DUF6479 family protein [Streptomyces sp. NRRL WC-3618]KOV61304.1 hypothetical protein ADL01_31475 [Streptomyces sp. NRRL WC-3618]